MQPAIPVYSPYNRLLQGLPAEEVRQLVSVLKVVPLTKDEILLEANEVIQYAYFPLQGIVSLIIPMLTGVVVEVGMVGNDGLVGLSVLWGVKTGNLRAVVQVPGLAMRIEAPLLANTFLQQPVLRTRLLHYMHAFSVQATQTAACNALHQLSARLARWLLMINDRGQTHELRVTQEVMADLMGVRRATVTEIINRFTQAGLIAHRRGVIQIVDKTGLEAEACECYRILAGYALTTSSPT